uniref:Uncharacterized protein n=1 Tax=Glossina pallidipes TaxID=7398 RepID=A0A1B0AIF2_GLOPL
MMSNWSAKQKKEGNKNPNWSSYARPNNWERSFGRHNNGSYWLAIVAKSRKKYLTHYVLLTVAREVPLAPVSWDYIRMESFPHLTISPELVGNAITRGSNEQFFVLINDADNMLR